MSFSDNLQGPANCTDMFDDATMAAIGGLSIKFCRKLVSKMKAHFAFHTAVIKKTFKLSLCNTFILPILKDYDILKTLLLNKELIFYIYSKKIPRSFFSSILEENVAFVCLRDRSRVYSIDPSIIQTRKKAIHSLLDKISRLKVRKYVWNFMTKISKSNFFSDTCLPSPPSTIFC